VTVVGNICETGDILAAGQELPALSEGDLLCVLDAGAYGFAMASNYNGRLHPAEVLIREDGQDVLIRRREALADLMRELSALDRGVSGATEALLRGGDGDLARFDLSWR
jgi:diaminopimelate decarboxylase